MQHFLNGKDQIVSEAMDGFLRSFGNDRLARLEGDPSVKIVVRSDFDRSKVVLISGGGSGHEPSHLGFVGKGMLTAAVLGEIFASPPVEAILTAIRAVTGPAGCLLIVKNYNGDRLNFGLAAEKARLEGYKVDIVIVADDIAIADALRPRGIAGTLFVHKVAGHAAEAACDLASVTAIARKAASGIRSLGIALSTCHIPGREAHDRLPEGKAELGLGIHGEPGIERIDLPSSAEIAELMSGRFVREDGSTGRYAMILNNLGGVSALEMSLIANDVLKSPIGQQTRMLVGPAPLMTAIDMRGFSISLLPLDDETEIALQAPTDASAWPGARLISEDIVRVAAPSGRKLAVAASADPVVRAAIEALARAVVAAEVELDAIDARIGDGDTGTTIANAGRMVLESLDDLPFADPAELARVLSDRLALVMGGSSGVLLSIFAAAVGQSLKESSDLQAALAAGLDRMEYYGGAREGHRTMLDALRPAVRELEKGFDAAAKAARDGADRTAFMSKAKAGRSSYIASSDLEGIPDPGAVAVAIAFEAVAASLGRR